MLAKDSFFPSRCKPVEKAEISHKSKFIETSPMSPLLQRKVSLPLIDSHYNRMHWYPGEDDYVVSILKYLSIGW